MWLLTRFLFITAAFHYLNKPEFGEMFRPYLVQMVHLTPGLPTGWHCGEGDTPHLTVNALVVCSVQMIMCNVAALTFYATIYEDPYHVCNKSRNKAETPQSTIIWFH